MPNLIENVGQQVNSEFDQRTKYEPEQVSNCT